MPGPLSDTIEFCPMRILVTGAAGFIGSATCRVLLDEGHSVIGIDNFMDQVYPAQRKFEQAATIRAHPNMQLLQADLRHFSVKELVRDIDVLVNLAAMPGLVPSWRNFDLYSECNTTVVFRLLEALRDFPDVHLVHASTSSVYGTESVGDENAPLRPVSPYGITKLAGEQLISAYREIFGIKATVLRLFSVYGPGQRPDMAYSLFCRRLLENEPLRITGDGQASRSNTYISDVVSAISLACAAQLDGRTMNICGDDEIALLDAVRILAEALGVNPKLEFVASRPGDQLRTKGDHTLASELLGWEPQTAVRDGLIAQARWEKAHGR